MIFVSRIYFLCYLFLLPSILNASGDPCADPERFEYSRYDYSSCSIDLEFVDSKNDSQGIFKMLFNIYLNEKFVNINAQDQNGWTDLKKLLADIDYQGNYIPKNDDELEYMYFNPSFLVNNNISTSNFIRGIASYEPKFERDLIIKSRLDLLENKEKEYQSLKDNNNTSHFWIYQKASAAFYNDQLSEASDLFCKLKTVDQPWIKEAAHISCARAKLISSQKNWDGYSALSETSINLDLLNSAENEFKSYLDLYPNGKYTKSAKGLLRRVCYLRGDTQTYLDLLAEAFEYELTKENFETTNLIIEELDRFLIKQYNLLNTPQKEANIVEQILKSKLHTVLKSASIVFYLRNATSDKISFIENWLVNNSENLNKYQGLSELLNSAVNLSLNKFDSIADANPNFQNAEINLAIMELKARAKDQSKQFDHAIEIRNNMRKIATKNNFINTAERISFAILKSILNNNQIDDILKQKSPPYGIKKWAVMNTIHYILSDSALKNICKNKNFNQEYAQEACIALTRRALYAITPEAALNYFDLLTPDSKDYFKEIRSFNHPRQVKIDNFEFLLDLGNFILDDKNSIYDQGRFKIYGNLNEFYKELNQSDNYQFWEANSKQSPIDLFESAMILSAKANNQEAEAQAIAGIIKCFAFTSRSFYCGDYTKMHKDYPSEKRKMLFERLKTKLKNTSASMSLKYWY